MMNLLKKDKLMNSLHSTILSVAGLTALFFTCNTSVLAQRMPHTRQAFIEDTNGLFAVAQVDHNTQTAHRWRGVRITREQLPPLSRFSNNTMVFARGDRPEIPTNNNDDAYWKPSTEQQLYYYGEIPYKVDEIDPELASYESTNSETLLGFQLHSRFYAVTNLGILNSSNLLSLTNTTLCHIQPQLPFIIIPVETPIHRVSEIQRLNDISKKEIHK